MTDFRQGDVVVVPFPYTESDRTYRRPVLIVSDRPLGERWPLAWVLMITSADNPGWPGDIDLSEIYGQAGLPAPSVVRTAKIANVETRFMCRLGRLPSRALDLVMLKVASNLGLAGSMKDTSR